MRVFLAGATGVIGRRLVPLLLAGGHQLTGMTRSLEKAEELRALGVEPAIADALEAAAKTRALQAAQPRQKAVIHQLTSIPPRIDPRMLERDFAMNDRLRSEGTRILVGAAQAAGVTRILAQSIAFSYAPGPPGTLHREQDQLLGDDAIKSFRRSALALRDLESTVLDAGGVPLRYGYFYGPGSAITCGRLDGGWTSRGGGFRSSGAGTGVWSLIHVDDAARATVAALTTGDCEALTTSSTTIPRPCRSGCRRSHRRSARRPRGKVPALLARPVAGAYGVAMMTKAQGASNELAKRELGWQPEHASWREGFRTALG